MSLDIGKIGKSLSGSLIGDGFNLQIGDAGKIAKTGVDFANGLFGGTQNSGFADRADGNGGQIQQFLGFALNLVKMVLDFVKGGGAAGGAPEVASNPNGAESASAAATNEASGTSSANAASSTASASPSASTDSSQQIKDAATAIEKQLSSISTAIKTLSDGASKLGKKAKSGLKGLFKKGIKLGEDFAKFSKLLGF